MKLNHQELACVLAGLRLLQDKVVHEGMSSASSMDQFNEVEPLDDLDLDMLCEYVGANIDFCPDVKAVWIKTHLHKDGSVQWDGVSGGKEAVNARIDELRSLGYHPVIDHRLEDPAPAFYTLLHAEDGLYKKPHINHENAMRHIKHQLGEHASPGLGGWVDGWGRTMQLIDMQTAVPEETLTQLDCAMIDTSGTGIEQALDA